MHTKTAEQIIIEAQQAFRSLSHLPDATELCKRQDEQLAQLLKELKP
jgi:hypothetical protein